MSVLHLPGNENGDTCEDIGDLEINLLELVRLRTAQIHQSPLPIRNHAEKLRTIGETMDRLEHLEKWEESGLFSCREQAALRWCERLSSEAPPPSTTLVQEMLCHFTKESVIALTLAIMAVNDWNYSF